MHVRGELGGGGVGGGGERGGGDVAQNSQKEVSALVLKVYEASAESNFVSLRICAWEAMLHKLAALKVARSLLSNSSTMASNMPA